MEDIPFKAYDLTILSALLPEQISDAILVTDAPKDGSPHRIIYANEAFLAMSGYELEELLGKSPSMFQGPATDQNVVARARAALKAGEAFNGTVVNYRKNGEAYIIGWKLIPVLGRHRELVQWLAIEQDITRRLALEDSVAGMEERLKVLLETLDEGIWYWDIRTNAIAWSARLKRMLGVHEIDFVPEMESYFDRITNSDKNKVRSALDAHLYREQDFDLEHEIVVHGGDIRIVRARGQAIWDDEGRPVRMIGTLRDTTTQRKLERDLLKAEQIANFGTWVLDVSTNTMRWSPQVYRIHGYEPYSIPLTLEFGVNAYHVDDRELVRRSVANAVESGTKFRFEARIVRPDGSERNVMTEGESEYGEDAKPIRIFGIITDQTKFKKQERELARSQRMHAIGQLVGGVAHDFNNLLAAIMGNLELMEDLPLDESGRSYVNSALTAAERGAALTQSLLSFARAAPLHEHTINPAHLIAETLPLLRRVLPENIAISAVGDIGGDTVHCDPTMLEACIMNLVVNARDSIEESGTITVSIERTSIDSTAALQSVSPMEIGAYIVISVTDSGRGMSALELERATEPFFTTKPVGTGTGLGLSRVLGFAEQSGGFLRLYSEKGKGTSARIYLPVSGGSEVSPPDGQRGPEHLERLEGRVILVEDQVSVRDVLEKIMKRFGLDVQTAETGDEGFRLFEADPNYAVVVTDIVMPGNLQGSHLVRKLRDRGYKFSAIYVSGYPRHSGVDENELLPSDSRLTKPVTRRDLYNALLKALGG